jgi:hypothetical protein
MLTPSESSYHTTESTPAPRGEGALELELDLELDAVFDELEGGKVLDLSPEDLDARS